MKKILLSIVILFFYSCGVSESEKERIAEKARAEKEKEIKRDLAEKEKLNRKYYLLSKKYEISEDDTKLITSMYLEEYYPAVHILTFDDDKYGLFQNGKYEDAMTKETYMKISDFIENVANKTNLPKNKISSLLYDLEAWEPLLQ